MPGECQLSLTSELREQLGLGSDESLRVIHSAGRVLTLERSGGTGVVAVPWDRDLVLTADVRSFSLADVLSSIHSASKSGFLLFLHGEHEKSIYLHRGEVVFATSNQQVDRLGESLLRCGEISLEELREADRRWTPTARFGKTLVELGILTPRELWNAVKSQVEEIVRTLFAYTDGMIHFWEGDVQPDNIVRLALPTRRLIAEGLRRRDELFKFLAVLEDTHTRLQPVEGMQAKLSSREAVFLDALTEEECGGRFAELCRRVGVDPLSGARTVQLLKLVGAIRLLREGLALEFLGEGDLRSHDEDLVRECVYDHIKLLGELTAPIVAVDGTEVVGERLGRVVEEAASRHSEMLNGLVVSSGGSIDPEEVLARALRLAGDRVRGVSEALGELVSYLEFELNNHPRIEGADVFLEAVEDLRAKLER